MPKDTAKRFLENLTIASPCHVNWDQMTGDERERFCNQCEKKVYNLSEMSRTEAERFMIEKEGRVCIRMYVRHDGTVMTDDCPVGLRKAKRMFEAARMRALKATAACAAMFSSICIGNIANAQTSSTAPQQTPATPSKEKPRLNSRFPVMGEPCFPEITPEQAKLEKSVSDKVSAAISAGVPQENQPKAGSLQFFITNGKADRVQMAVTTGDKSLDDKIISIVKSTELSLPKDGFPQWKSIVINFTSTDQDSKVQLKEAKKN